MTKKELRHHIAQQNPTYYPHLQFHLPKVLDLLNELFISGERTHEPLDWRKKGYHGNLARADKHRELWLRGEKSEDHELHEIARRLCALEISR